MTYEDTLQDHITDLYLQVQDLKKRGIKADEAIRGLERRIDALERRIERIDGMLDGMGKGIEARLLDAESRIAAIERKLNHKGGDE